MRRSHGHAGAMPEPERGTRSVEYRKQEVLERSTGDIERQRTKLCLDTSEGSSVLGVR